jgi:hypothetical protein
MATESSEVTALKKMHYILGESIHYPDIEARVNKATQENKNKIFGAVSRIMVVDTIQAGKKGLDAWKLVNLDALQVYLLCTCIDALANHAVGVEKRFREVIKGLPKLIREELTQAYSIISEPDENHETWDSFDIAEKENRVIDYLYSLRRNTFTHNAQIVPTASTTRGVEGLSRFIHPGVWNYSVYFIRKNPKYGEVLLLRLVVIAKIRQILNLPIDSSFLQSYWHMPS